MVRVVGDLFCDIALCVSSALRVGVFANVLIYIWVVYVLCLYVLLFVGYDFGGFAFVL